MRLTILWHCFIEEVKHEITAEAYDELSNKAANIPAKLLSLCNKKGKDDKKYEDSVREFCISVHMKSPSAYRYIRNCFKNALPCERTFRKWCQKMDCTPGFSQGALKYLSVKSQEYQQNGEHLLCSLTFDEMAIREHIQFDGMLT